MGDTCYVCSGRITRGDKSVLLVLGDRTRHFAHERCANQLRDAVIAQERSYTPPRFQTIEEADDWLYQHRPAPF